MVHTVSVGFLSLAFRIDVCLLILHAGILLMYFLRTRSPVMAGLTCPLLRYPSYTTQENDERSEQAKFSTFLLYFFCGCTAQAFLSD